MAKRSSENKATGQKGRPKKVLMKKEPVLFWIVTGMSGAGKSQTINCFEDFGFFCVDNIPVELLPKMAELCSRSGRPLQRVVWRSGSISGKADSCAIFWAPPNSSSGRGVDCKIVFFEADDRTPPRRFSENGAGAIRWGRASRWNQGRAKAAAED